MRKKIGILSILLSVIVSLVSCGGSGGVPAKAPTAKLDGTATDAVITNGVLKIYAFDGGVKGDLITETTTDAKGDFHFDSFTSPDRPIMIEVSGGSYTEEASGVSVDLLPGQILRAYMYYQQGSEVTVQVTPLTHLASCLADYKIRMGANINNAITEATSVFSGLAGIDILGTRPLDITDPNNADFQVTDGLRYGTILAAISSFTAEASVTNGVTPHRFNQNSSIYATQVLCQDIALDGIFNGMGTIGNGSAGQLSLGSVALDANTFRTMIAQHILSIISSDRNATGLGIDSFVLYANEVASSTDAIFGGVPPTPVDKEGPVVTATLAPDSFLKGIVDLNFTVADPIGVKSVRFKVNDVAHSTAQADNPVLSLNTSNYTDGIIKISVVATDTLNNESVVDYNYVVDNTSPTIALTSSQLVANKNYTASGTYQEQGSPVTSILVNDVPAAIDTALHTWSAPLTLVSGNNILTLKITDEAVNVKSVDVVVGVDLVFPQITPNNTIATFTTYQGQLNLCTSGQVNPSSSISNPICISTDNVSLNGATIDAGLQSQGYIMLGFSPTDPQGAGVFTNQDDLLVDYKYEVNDVVIVDWTQAPKSNGNLYYYFPMVTEYLGSNWFNTSTSDIHKVTFRVTDKAGNFKELPFILQFDVLVPEFTVNTTVDSSAITNNTYATRFAVDGSLLNVDYEFANNSNSPFYISLNDSANHFLDHTYKTAVKENYARVIQQNEERFYGGNDPAFQGVTTVYDGNGSPRNLITPVSQGSYVQYYTDSPPEPAGTTPWQYVANAEICNNHPVKSIVPPADYIYWPTITYSTFNTNPALTGKYGAQFTIQAPADLTCEQTLAYSEPLLYNGPVPAYSDVWEKRTHVYNEVKPGFPSVVYKDVTDQSRFNTEELQVFNNDLGQQILPTNGWYLIPKNTRIAIVKKVRLPVINHYTDAEVLSPAVFTSYTPLGVDLSTKWSIDTDLQINRVIDTGNVNTLDSASKTTKTVGMGLEVYTISL